MTEPLGKLFELTFESQRALIREVGAALFLYEVDGHTVAAGPSVTNALVDVYKGSRGAVLVPFPNRVKEGKYSVDGANLQLPTSGEHASHGFARTQRFDVVEQTASSITLSTRMFAQVGYPWVLDLTMTYALNADGLRVACHVRNACDRDAPLVVGFHPYFTAGSSSVDHDQLTVPASHYLPLDDTLIPDGAHAEVHGDWDFRNTKALDGIELDATFFGLERDGNGIATVSLHSTETNRTVDVWMDESFGYVQGFSSDTLALESDRRKFVAIEPMSGAPNAFNTGDGLLMLEPDTTFSGVWGVRAH